MSLVTRYHDSGLIVAEQAMDEQALGRALKQIDDRLVLQKHPRDGVAGGWVYKVICLVNDHYAPVVLTWMDEYGVPRPLSSGLLDEMQRHMLGARNGVEDTDAFNQRLVARREKDSENAVDAVIGDHFHRVERDRTAVSLAHKQRRPEWLKANRGRVTR